MGRQVDIYSEVARYRVGGQQVDIYSEVAIYRERVGMYTYIVM